MTAIVGLLYPDGVILGADSQMTETSSMVTFLNPRSQSKLIHRGDLLLGVSGSMRLLNLIEHAWDPPETYFTVIEPDPRSLVGKMVELLNSLREMTEKQGVLAPSKDPNAGAGLMMEGRLLIACQGRLFYVSDGFDLSEVSSYAAIGMASGIAMGSLFATGETKLTSMDRVLAALRAAMAHDATVGGESMTAVQGKPS